jgi:hypothetical protein
MEGTIPQRELTARKANVEFSVARPSDDFEIRRLLRANPTAGRISLSFAREPNYFAGSFAPSATTQTIVARTKNELVCVGSCAIRQCFVNGEPRRVGYLGGLRLDSRYAGRFDILRRGYDYFFRLQEDPADFYFTSIAADNVRARKFLERTARGMPRYEFIGDFVTLMIPTRGRSFPADYRRSQAAWSGDLHRLLNESNRRHQFAPCWPSHESQLMAEPGLQPSDFFVLRARQEVKACGAVWDQRRFKQVVVRNYSRSLKFMRPLFNSLSKCTAAPRLPAVGEVLSHAFASHLAATTEKNLTELMNGLLGLAAGRGIEYLTAGFASNDPRLAAVGKNFHGRKYHTRLYVVRWPEVGASARELDGRVLSPEVALL